MVGVNRRTRRLFTETLVGELVGISGSLLAGYGLAFMLDDLRSLPAFLVLVPAFLEMRGNISGASAARTATALHLGTITSRLEFSEELQTEIVVSTFLGIFLSAVLGVVAHFFS
ncbi:MAG: magnesium transporter, partial [Candidatus Geothermarchaeales archaeon]